MKYDKTNNVLDKILIEYSDLLPEDFRKPLIKKPSNWLKSMDILEKQGYFDNIWYKQDVVFYFGCYRKDYEHLLFPVANRLAEKGMNVVLIVYDTSSPNLLKLSPAVIKHSYRKIVNDHNVKEEAGFYYNQYFKKSLRHFSKNNRSSLAYFKLQSFLKRFAFDYILTKKIIREWRPKCVYAIHFLLTPGCLHAIDEAEKPVLKVLIQHGLIDPVPEEKHHFIGADIAFLWGDFFGEILLKKKIVPRTAILGSPKISHLLYERNEALIRKTSDEFIILYIFTGSMKDKSAQENALLFFKAISSFTKVRVLYKLHPNSRKQECHEFIKRGLMIEKNIYHDVSIYPLIRACDLAVGDYSTALFEAAALGKAVIQIYKNNFPEIFLKFASASNEAELRDIIQRLMTDKVFRSEWSAKQHGPVTSLFYSIDGADERIAAFLQNALQPVKR